MRFTQLLAGVGLTATALLSTPVAAQAAWSSGGAGTGLAGAAVLPAGPTPTVAVSNGSSVKVSWTPTSVTAGAPVRGFQVVRTDESTGRTTPAEQGCAGVFTRTTQCTEGSMPPGRWTYGIVTLVGDNWTSPPGFAPTVQVNPVKQLLVAPSPNPVATPSASPTRPASPSSASPSSASPSSASPSSVSPSPSAPEPSPSPSPSEGPSPSGAPKPAESAQPSEAPKPSEASTPAEASPSNTPG
ncbi:hypothetical protein [Actinoplanes sp. NPDC051411]|uniref:hypothetical protein n=1 Tax=Actinoplanes sp. NPDC051411 TaxID=3155522 RepID=UPI0034273C3F